MKRLIIVIRCKGLQTTIRTSNNLVVVELQNCPVSVVKENEKERTIEQHREEGQVKAEEGEEVEGLSDLVRFLFCVVFFKKFLQLLIADLDLREKIRIDARSGFHSKK